MILLVTAEEQFAVIVLTVEVSNDVIFDFHNDMVTPSPAAPSESVYSADFPVPSVPSDTFIQTFPAESVTDECLEEGPSATAVESLSVIN